MKHFIFNGIKASFVWLWFNAIFSFLNFFLSNTLYIAADTNFAMKVLSIVVILGLLIGLCYCARIFYKFGKGSLHKFDKNFLNLFSIVFVHIFILLFCGWIISYVDMMMVILNWFLYTVETFFSLTFNIYWDFSDEFFLNVLLSFVPYIFMFLGLRKGYCTIGKTLEKSGDTKKS